jgi:pimeloyl-ACP methyl ester carboxylesterase
MTEQMVAVNGVQLCVEGFGDPRAPAILLIGGAASSMDLWHPRFCELLAAQGRRVIRYDHRDTGRSASYPPGAPGYTGPDLVFDAAALIDTVGGGRAHVVGLSMGGAMAQVLAVQQPERVSTLTLIATSSGPAEDLPPPAKRIREIFENPLPEPDWSSSDAVVDYLVENERPYAGPQSFNEEQAREAARVVVSRTVNLESSAKNHWLLEGGEDVRPRLGEVRAPTLVIHGTEDPFFPAGHGEALAREIPGARLLLIDGMGHQAPPPPAWDVIVTAIARHTA